MDNKNLFKGVTKMTKEEVLQKVQFHTELRGLSKNTQEEYPRRILHKSQDVPKSF